MQLLGQFVGFVREAAAHKLVAVDRAILDALKDGDEASLPALRADRTRLRELPETIRDGDRAALVAQWPNDFPPLPEWFTDPGAAAAKDPPGPPCEVDLSAVVLENDEGGAGETVPLDLQAEILAKRAEKSIAEDALRATGTVPVAVNTDREVSAEDLGL